MTKKRILRGFAALSGVLVLLVLTVSCQMDSGGKNSNDGGAEAGKISNAVVAPANPVIRLEAVNEPGFAIRHRESRGRIDTYVSPYQDAEFRLVAGLADSSLVSLESVNFPGRYVRHRNGEIWIDANDGSGVFAADATWRMKAGLADASKVSFESYNFPGEYIRHRDYLLYRTAVSTDTDRQDATFHKWQFNWSWVKGAVFVPTNVTNQIQQWDQYDPVINDRELYYASVYGINVVRVYLHYFVWQNDKTRLLNNIEDFLVKAARYGIKVEFVFFDDCWNDHPVFGYYPAPIFGVHNSRWVECPGDDVKADYQNHKTRLQAYVQDVVNAHRFDSRIIFWEIYNEPGNGESGTYLDVTNQIMTDARTWIKQTGTNIPVTSTDWTDAAKATSDFYSWHVYGGYPAPPANSYSTLNTECMNREGQSVPGIVDYFNVNNTGFIIWEAGIGRDNCRYRWGDADVEPSAPFHGLFYPDGHPWALADAMAMRGDDLSGAPVFNVSYYSDVNFAQLKKTSVTPSIDFDLGDEFGTGSPDASVGIGTDYFSTRWTGTVKPAAGGTYVFYADCDSIVRIWVNGVLVINKTTAARAEVSGSINLAAATAYEFRVEYVHYTGNSSLHVRWSGPGLVKQVLMGSREGIVSSISRIESRNISGAFIRHSYARGRIDIAVTPFEDSQWRIVPGLADANFVSIESVNFPGRFLRHRDGEIWSEANDGSALFAADATWVMVPGLADSNGVSFDSYNFRGEYMRHRNWELWRTAIVSDLDRNDATFYIR